MGKERVLLADDHKIVLDGFKKLLEPTYQIVGTASDGRQLIEQAVKLRPDVLLADISMPQLNGLDACERLKALAPEVRVIFLTMTEDSDTAAEAIRRGASGYLLKKCSSAELFTAIRTVLQGRTYLTPSLSHGMTSLFVAQAKASRGARKLSLRQREVLQLLAEGRSMKEAADSLKVTPRTIAFHKYSIMEQIGVKTSAELVRYAMQQLGMVPNRPAAGPAA